MKTPSQTPSIPSFIIGAAQSGTGKTTLACGLAAAFRRRGLDVRPFKIGPDYIDPSHLSQAAGRPCYNLDTWMTGKTGLLRSFARGAVGGNLALIEGVMGLFDGTAKGASSTAEVAKLLRAPVLLVLNAKGIGQTLAPLARGIIDFDPEIEFLGVVVTETASPRQEKIFLRAFQQVGLKCLGFLPRNPAFKLPKRHLGLVMAEEMGADFYDRLGDFVAQNFSLTPLLERAKKVSFSPPKIPSSPVKARIAVAKDAAFCFYYQENLDLLVEAGAEIVFFSPLKGEFPRAQGYYLGGGYPELFASELARQKGVLAGFKEAYQKGRPIWAECGGFMFLNQRLSVEGKTYPLAGILPGEVIFTSKLRALGYRKVIPLTSNPLGLLPLRGHEFRYSTLQNDLQKGFKAFDASGALTQTFGLVGENLFASYLHVHLGSQPEAAQNFVSFASQFD